ncbi:MAG: hypothetical protein JWR16_492 [Nevskia sp.]|nr:hypothetical protein [Nevskia sp.]
MTEFPHSAGAFAEVRRYIGAVAQFADFPSAQTVIRLKAELRKTTDPVREGELLYEIEVAEQDARSTVPRIIWGSILVAIYATFETGVRNALSHWASNVPGAAEFQVGGKGHFLKIASAYSESEVGTELFPDKGLKEAVLELKAFRDSFAHSAGQLPSRRTQLHSSIDKATKRGLAVTVEDGNWGATPRLVAYYFLRVERSYELFSNAVMSIYVSRMSLHAEHA